MDTVVEINKDACTGCGACVSMCPQKILYINKKTKKCEVTDHSKCDRLGGCERVCPATAIKIAGGSGFFSALKKAIGI